jgi:hypothetical protein
MANSCRLRPLPIARFRNMLIAVGFRQQGHDSKTDLLGAAAPPKRGGLRNSPGRHAI